MSTEVPEDAPENSSSPPGSDPNNPNYNDVQPAAQPPEVEQLQAKLKDQESKYAYLYADFDNYKKRVIKERSDLLKFGWESSAKDLLQVVDNLERAVEHAPATTERSLLQGLEMVLGQFKTVLEKQGVQPIQAVGKPFDPNLEEAVTQEHADYPAGVVSREHSRGYTLHGRLLRAAQVVVSAGPKES